MLAAAGLGAPERRRLLQVLLSFYVLNGAAAALGLLLISAGVHLLLGAAAAGAASIGVIACIPPDQAAPMRGKLWQLLPAAVVGIPLFFAVQLLRDAPVWLGLLLVPASFLAFLGGAWGKRGLPLAMSAMFSLVFSMALPQPGSFADALSQTLYFALGASLYLVYATLANAVLNRRYRTQMLADTLLALAHLMRTQAEQFMRSAGEDRREQVPLIGLLLGQQAALNDQLQAARDIVLESPNSVHRLQLAAMLVGVLEMRDHLTACALDLEALSESSGNFLAMEGLHAVLHGLATDMESLADSLLHGARPAPLSNRRPALQELAWDTGRASAQTRMLARGLANRVGNLNDEAMHMVALANASAAPDTALIRSSWQMFVSSTDWSWRPFVAVWHRDAPALRHAVRAALAIGFAYVLGLLSPWGSHEYWILITIVVVLRGSLAQTLERRNSRVLGTLIGCVLAGLVLATHAPVWVMLLVLTLAQGVAHAFALRTYLFTAVAATLLGLVQAHLVSVGVSPAFAVLERVADTLLGVSIAWAFSYVLPSWERGQIAALVARALAAQARYARISLTLDQLQRVESAPELEWRLARRGCYETLSALVQATQRALHEPRAVQPPLEPLGRIMARSYQLLAQLTSVKTMLLLRRERLQLGQIRQPLLDAAQAMDAALMRRAAAHAPIAPARPTAADSDPLPDPFESDLTPWLLRRLGLSVALAAQLRDEARDFLQADAAPS